MSPSPPRLVLFDCDGVLIDSEVIACRIEVEMLGALGHPVTLEQFRDRFVGTSRGYSLAALAADWGRPLPEDYAEQVRDRLDAAFASELKAIDGMSALVRGLGDRCAVASSSSRRRLSLTLKLTGFAPLFGERVFSAEQVARGKPAPDLFLFAARALGTAASGCIVVEDSPFGIEAAHAAGMTAIGFVAGSHCGADHAGRLWQAGAAEIATDAADLARVIGRLVS